MPTYEYQCPECGKKFEKYEAMTSEPRAACPRCGTKAERLISGGAGIFVRAAEGESQESCCGTTNPCDDPKRCCGR
ncbi:hypothetical protein AMJ39_04105 [candidate division TA06 bacterium DG_24]|jgi:putative FmdB family regulatory protein|uniref:Putative regulatory protein FmdB zinc ribbon domain-containing protein n=3 Tax=Bacteria division TA06 TaxID=1156500 RepID=A0A0S8J9I1_UNCT6|nr:MAG: hypothetical protein AMJ39_04105 [candidate division TA06 bacterium DG_24]KPK70582.1 MAG: hypothetical protein AMJ82_02925 [candidate division TA06 bacterium SM23_40]KPL06438.1 MAG: hypothetical protein AMJ71_09690 [candidate division TA06 bacterium SM1_40]